MFIVLSYELTKNKKIMTIMYCVFLLFMQNYNNYQAKV